MPVRTIQVMGHPVLAAVAAAVPDPTSADTRSLVTDLVDTMVDANGAGLAAPQIGVGLRVVVFQAPASRVDPGLSAEEAFDHTAPLTVLVNPVIEVLDESREGGWEGCLSIPGLRGWVERPSHIRYSGFGLDGTRVERVARGFHARVVQHECDHLDGVLYPQRMRDLRRLIFASQAHHWAGEKFYAPLRPSEQPQPPASSQQAHAQQ